MRNAEKAAPLAEQGVDLVVGDVGDETVLAKAMEGVDGLMLTLPNGPNQLDWEMGILRQAEQSGVTHVAYMSSTESNPENSRRIPQVHVKVVRALQESNMGWTILRPNFFMQNMFMFLAPIKASNSFIFPSGDGKAAMCDVSDIGEVAALVMTSDGHMGKSYDLTGPELLTLHDAAGILSKVVGRTITYVPESLEDFRERMQNILTSQWHIEGVVELMQEMAEEGGLDYTTNTIEDLLGRPPKSLAQFLETHKAMFEA